MLSIAAGHSRHSNLFCRRAACLWAVAVCAWYWAGISCRSWPSPEMPATPWWEMDEETPNGSHGREVAARLPRISWSQNSPAQGRTTHTSRRCWQARSPVGSEGPAARGLLYMLLMIPAADNNVIHPGKSSLAVSYGPRAIGRMALWASSFTGIGRKGDGDGILLHVLWVDKGTDGTLSAGQTVQPAVLAAKSSMLGRW